MTAEEKECLNRARELSRRAQARGIYTRTHFLTEGEQTQIAALSLPLLPRFFGGYPEAERRVAVFGREEDLFYPWESDISLLMIRQPDPKFRQALGHRDFLGAVLNLGIKRELLGDLLVSEDTGYLFCLAPIDRYIQENLTRVRHSPVTVERIEQLPESVSACTVEETPVCASPRLDAVVSAVFDLSRAEGRGLVEGEKVSLKGIFCTDPGRVLVPGERVSVRGYGRFYFDGEVKKTRSGRSRIVIRRFQ